MANDINLWQDIETCQENLENAKTKEDKALWKAEIKQLTKQFNKLYI